MNHTNFIENSKKKSNLPTKQCNVTNNGKKKPKHCFSPKKKKSQPDQGSDYFHKGFFLPQQKIHN